MNAPRATVTLSLISHTNAGKTTLARTLLKRDVGEVRDEAHVTDISEAHVMIATPEGDRLLLWDTPGFGDSVRLLKRLRQAEHGNPIGWFLHQVWDRWTNRPLWCSQQAVKNVHDEADVVLYLVNAAERPSDARYVEVEMEILGFLQKPIIVLLNHVGQDPVRIAAETEVWSRHLASMPLVRHVTSLDAYSRCWVQEDALLELIVDVLPDDRKSTGRALAAAWSNQNRETFDRSMQVLARHLARLAQDRERIPRAEGVRGLLNLVTGRKAAGQAAASRGLTARLNAETRLTFDELLRLHQLDGAAGAEIQAHLREAFVTGRGLDETASTVLGGLISGALTGLTADFLSGGLTFGGGAVAGAILGASGAKLLARGYNLINRDDHDLLRWSPDMLMSFVRLALLRYLAVAHYGRGRGSFADSAQPGAWPDALSAALAPRSDDFEAALAAADERSLHRLLAASAESVLAALHPAAGARPRTG